MFKRLVQKSGSWGQKSEQTGLLLAIGDEEWQPFWGALPLQTRVATRPASSSYSSFCLSFSVVRRNKRLVWCAVHWWWWRTESQTAAGQVDTVSSSVLRLAEVKGQWWEMHRHLATLLLVHRNRTTWTVQRGCRPVNCGYSSWNR